MNRLFLVLLIFPLMFISCEEEVDNQNNDDQNNNNTVSILGTWRFVSQTFTEEEGYIDPISGNEVITDSETQVFDFPGFDPVDGIYEDYYSFIDNNSLLYIETYDNDNTVYIDTFNYVKNGSEIVLSDWDYFGGNTFITITELSDTYLNLNWYDDYTYSENDTSFFMREITVENLIRSDFTYLEGQNSHNNKSIRRNRSFINRKMGDK